MLLDLSPSCSGDHQIVLEPGAEPPSIRPYCYPQFQKEEIKRLVLDMLASGVIRPSSSPLSSPVLVKKKDGSWRFWVDYRALNKLIVPIADCCYIFKPNATLSCDSIIRTIVNLYSQQLVWIKLELGVFFRQQTLFSKMSYCGSFFYIFCSCILISCATSFLPSVIRGIITY